MQITALMPPLRQALTSPSVMRHQTQQCPPKNNNPCALENSGFQRLRPAWPEPPREYLFGHEKPGAWPGGGRSSHNPPRKRCATFGGCGSNYPLWRPLGKTYKHLLANSRAARTSALTILDSSRSCARWPPFHAFRLTSALPSSDLGPVDLAHGLQLLISSACRCLRSNVQPLTMICLQ